LFLATATESAMRVGKYLRGAVLLVLRKASATRAGSGACGGRWLPRTAGRTRSSNDSPAGLPLHLDDPHLHRMTLEAGCRQPAKKMAQVGGRGRTGEHHVSAIGRARGFTRA